MLKVYVEKAEIPIPPFLGQGAWVLSGLTAVTVLLGKNGSGKSILMRQWRDDAMTWSHYVIPERSGDLTFQAMYSTSQRDPNQRRNAAAKNYLGEYRQHIVARIQSYFSARGNVRGKTLPSDPGRMETILSQLLPDFSMELDADHTPPYRLSRASDNSPVNSIDDLSSGEAQLLTVALDVLTMGGIWDVQAAERRLIFIDEPDAHIHPDLQVRFANFLFEAAREFKLQIVVATHSTTLLAAIGQFGGGDASVIYLNREQREFDSKPFTAAVKEIAACLGGHALMGPLFGVPLVLVEGDDDYRIWSQVPRHHKVSLAAIPANGAQEVKTYQHSLEQIFSSLRQPTDKPAGFALLDGDQAVPIRGAQSPQEHIQFIQLACLESENLYLTDEVLSLLGKTWETAALEIEGAASAHGAKTHLLASATTWERKRHKIKNIINEIAAILDPKKLHWTIRVATALGRDVPGGQLLEFLGPSVASAIWGDAVSARAD